MRSYKDDVIEQLAEENAALRELATARESDVQIYREMFVLLLEYAHDQLVKYERLSTRYHRLLDEAREMWRERRAA